MSIFSNIGASLSKAVTNYGASDSMASKILQTGLSQLAKPQPPLAPPTPRAAEVLKGDLNATAFHSDLKWVGGLSKLSLKNIFQIPEPSAAGKFHTQAGASNYIADSMTSFGNGRAVDKKVQDAVRDACNRWKPGQDLAAMCQAAVKTALKGLLPDSYTPPPMTFQGPKTPDAVANMVANQIRANGSTPISAAEHMVAAERAYQPPH